MPRLLTLDLLPLLASVLHGWVVRLRAEQQLFGGAGGGAGGSLRGGANSGSRASGAKQPVPRGRAEGAADPRAVGDDAAAAALAPQPPDSPAEWEEKVVAAAEVTEEAAMAALGLLDALVADPAGEAATNASGERLGGCFPRLWGGSC